MMETNWIRFDPDDKLTWPEMEDEISGKTVLACDDEGHIYIAYLLNMIDKDPMWFLTNEAEDLEVPAHCVVAWMPLPKPFYATLSNRRMNPYLRETHESQGGAGK